MALIKKIPERLGSGSLPEPQLRHDPITIGQGPRKGRALAFQQSKRGSR
jgi:hypothetical protein